MASQAFVYPLETVKTRLQAAPQGYYGGIVDCMSKIVRSEGMMGLYRGLGTALVGRIPYSGVPAAHPLGLGGGGGGGALAFSLH